MSETPETAVPTAPHGEISNLAEHLFRHEAGKLVSILTGLFGTERLQMAEDVVQESLVRALQTWPYYGVPKNPAAWLTQTAKHLAVDLLRREKTFRDKEPQITALVEQHSDTGEAVKSLSFEEEIKDDRLRLMFVCCHPAVPEEAQIALALKTLCGFSPAEIAKAFLTSEAAIAKRLVRAKQRIRELRIAFEIPTGDELSNRLEAVLKALYLLFNEGYKASSGDKLVREELCQEAIRLGALLVEQPAGNQPHAHALLALMLLNGARLPGRTDAEGNVLRLKEQDRSKWHSSMVARGMYHLAQSAKGETLTSYHLQAAISACHCAAATYEATDWRQILALYDRLTSLDQSPVVALNRAVAVAQVHGPQAGMESLASIRDGGSLESYYLLYVVRAEFEAELNQFQSAADNLRQALRLTELKSEQSFLSNRLRMMEERSCAGSS